METPRQAHPARKLLIIGGNLALDLANTVDDPNGPAHHDHADTWAELLAWSTHVETVSRAHAARLDQVVPVVVKDATVRRAQELREAITRIFGSCADGTPPRPEHWRALRPFVADALAHASINEPGTGAAQLYWPPSDDPADLWRPIASAATDLLRSTDLRRLKRCNQCPWLFVDHSRNHSRRWCSMDDCGTAVKMDRYIARRAAANRRS